jgi:glycosyltransferase involved in cell wall biosynthesis
MTDPPRVADLIPRVQLRGAEIFAQHLEVALRDRYETRLLPLYRDGRERWAWIGDAAPLDWRRGVSDGVGRLPRAAWALRRRARTFRPDVIVAHGGDPLRVAALAGLHRIAPIVYLRVAAVTPDLRTPARSMSLRWAYRHVDSFVAVSESLREELIEVFGVPGAKVRVIPNGRLAPPLPSAEERTRIRRELGLEADQVLVIWVGRFVREKDPVAAIDLAKRLESSASSARVVVVGTGPLLPNVRTAVGSSRVVLTGERDDASSLIGAADLLVSTSRTEGAPGVFVEALLAGVPVVAHDMGGVRDVISEKTGALVPPRDRRAFATAVAELVNDAGARELAASAAQEAGARFSIESVADQYDELYREVLAGKR